MKSIKCLMSNFSKKMLGNTKKNRLSILGAFALVVSVLAFITPYTGMRGQTPPVAEQAPPVGEQTPQGANRTKAGGPKSIEIQDQKLFLEVLEDFEDAEDWAAKSMSPLGETKTLKLVQRGEIRSTENESVRPPEEEAYSVSQNPTNPNHILGIKGYFDRPGFDRIEVKPPHEYKIRGKVRQFSIWVLGRNFRHNLYMKVKDYHGRVHELHLGRLNFYGWNKLTVVVPGWMPQSTRYSLVDRNLHFVSFFVEADHHEPRGEFYFYIDGLKALIDRSEQDYPGAEIKDNW